MSPVSKLAKKSPKKAIHLSAKGNTKKIASKAKKSFSKKQSLVKAPLTKKSSTRHGLQKTTTLSKKTASPIPSSKKSLIKKRATKPIILKTPKNTVKTAKKIVTKKTQTPLPLSKKLIKSNQAQTRTQKKGFIEAVATPKPIAHSPTTSILRSKKTHSQIPSASTKKDLKMPIISPQKAALLLKARHRPTSPAFLKRHSRRNTQIYFSLKDVLQVIQTQSKENQIHSETGTPSIYPHHSSASKPSIPKNIPKPKVNVHHAASLIDILGFNPNEKKKPKWQEYDESKVQKKYLPYFKALIDFRKHVQEGMDLHAQETLKHSSKDDSGDLSGYAQHIADAGTDTFDRDFALGLLSNEQDLMYEIDEAIQRIFDGTYGICEITHKPINKERLLAVPFTRFSIEGQREYEKTHRPHHQRTTGGIFSEIESDSTRAADIEEEF